MNYMRMLTTKDDSKIPEGKAVLTWDNNGWVGTNSGWPMYGMPALFPKAQAEAIIAAVGYVQMYHRTLDEMPHPEAVSEAAKKWLFGEYSIDPSL